MTGQLQFKRGYAAFGSQVRPFEMDDSVGFVVTEFSTHEGYSFYPIGAIIGAEISTAWLGEGQAPAPDEKGSPDIIFKMRDDYPFFEIVLRSDAKTSWGGSIYGQTLEVTDEVVAGHRVLVAEVDGVRDRYEYNSRMGQYICASKSGKAKRPTATVLKIANSGRR